LGLGSGWNERDYDEYGYEFKTAPARLRDLDAAIPVMLDRIGRLNPPPVHGKLPILIGGEGGEVTLRITAQYADIWHGFGAPADLQRLNGVLDDWCAKVGRNPAAIERSATAEPDVLVARADDYVAAGVTHLLTEATGPDFDFEPLRKLIAWRDERRG